MQHGGTVRLALIGCGGFSGTLATAIAVSAGTELSVCHDVDPEARGRCSTEFGCAEAVDLDEVLDRGDVDGVVLATPNAVHADQAVRAAAAGKHVFSEKPIANTLEDGRRMIDACRDTGVVLMVGHSRRRLAAARRARELIEAGAIGTPILIEATTTNTQGFELTPESFRWRGDDGGCPGGSLMTLGIHAADLFAYLLGPIESVMADAVRLAIPAPVEDVDVTICRFRSGVLGSIATSYATPRRNTVRVSGTRGSLEWSTSFPDLPGEQFFRRLFEVDRHTPLTFTPGDGSARRVPLTPGNPYVEEIEEFAACIRTGATPETDGPGALAALAYVRAAIESAGSGRRVPLAG